VVPQQPRVRCRIYGLKAMDSTLRFSGCFGSRRVVQLTAACLLGFASDSLLLRVASVAAYCCICGCLPLHLLLRAVAPFGFCSSGCLLLHLRLLAVAPLLCSHSHHYRHVSCNAGECESGTTGAPPVPPAPAGPVDPMPDNSTLTCSYNGKARHSLFAFSPKSLACSLACMVQVQLHSFRAFTSLAVVAMSSVATHTAGAWDHFHQ
jgi:hypothetical protein